MQKQTHATEESKRNITLSIRLASKEHQLIVDTAWRTRQSASQLIRESVLSQLRSGVAEGIAK